MKVYLASSFSLVEHVKFVADSLKRCGHEVTSEWWHFDYKTIVTPDDKLWYQLPEVQAVCARNFKAVEDADCLLLVCDPTTAKKFNGANIELGYALAHDKPCFSIGQLERSAMYVPVAKCNDLKHFLQKIKEA